MQKDLSKIEEDLISLAEASKLSGYNQDYLGSLCRKGELLGSKIGRNWVVSRHALKELLLQKEDSRISSFTSGLSTLLEPKAVQVEELGQLSVVAAGVASQIESRLNNLRSKSALEKTEDLASKVIPSLEKKLADLETKVREFGEVGVPGLEDQVVTQSQVKNTRRINEKFASNFGIENEIVSEAIVMTEEEDKIAMSPQVGNLNSYIQIASVAVLAVVLFMLFLHPLSFLQSFFGVAKEYVITYRTNKSGEAYVANGDLVNGEVLGLQSGPVKSVTPIKIDERYLTKFVQDQLVWAETLGFFRGSKGEPGVSGSNGANGLSGIGNSGGSGYGYNAPAPIYVIPPQPAQNFNGALLSSATDFSTKYLHVDTLLDVTSGATANFAGNTNFTGTVTFSGSGTLNPNLTVGSVPFQGASSLTQDNSNFFFDDTNNALGLGTNTINASAILQLDATSKGFLPPRLTTAQKNAISAPATGLTIFDTDLSKLNVYNGSVWKNVGSPEIGGEITNGTAGSILFVNPASTLTQDNSNLFYDATNHRLGLGTTSPTTTLDVAGTLKASGAVTLGGTSLQLTGTSPVLDLTSASTLSINTTTNRPVTFGTGTVTIPNLSVTNSQGNSGTMTIDSNATTQTIFQVTGNSLTSGTGIGKTITANAGNGQITTAESISLTDATVAGGGYTGIGVTVSGSGSGSGNKYLLDLNPGTNKQVVFDSAGAFRPTTSVASNTNTIGSSSYYWKNGYFDQITANNLAGTVITGATSSTTWTIGSTQAGDVNEAIIFQRNSGSGNATVQWNAGASDLRYLTANYPLNSTYTVTDSSIGTGINLFSANLTNNTTGGTQKLLSLTNTGTGTTENGIYINNTGTGTTGIEIAGTWTTGLLTNNNSINAGTGTITSGAINSQTISSAANFTGTVAAATSLTVPIIYGGSGASSTLTLAGTSNGSPSAANIILNGTGQGNVGIGTTSPGYALHVVGNVLNTGRSAFGNNATINPVALGANDTTGLSVYENLSSFQATGNTQYQAQKNYLAVNSTSTPAGAIFVFGNDTTVSVGAGNTSNTTLLIGNRTTVLRDAAASGNSAIGARSESASLIYTGSGTFGQSNVETGIIGGFFSSNVGGTITTANVAGVFGNGWAEDTATITNVYGLYGKASNHNTAGPAVANVVAVAADLDLGSHTTNAIGVHIFHSNTVMATTAYGVKIDSLPGTTNYGLYVNGTWDNYFGGNIGIGTTAPASALHVVAAAQTVASASTAEYTTGTFTSPTITLTGTTQVTSQMDSFLFNQPTITDASAVTVDKAATLTIAGAPISAGSVTLTDSYGLKINTASVTAATRATSLYVDAPTGGTANYAAVFASGNVGIGTTAPGQKLDVTGSIQASSSFLAPNGSVSAPSYAFTGDTNTGIYRSAASNIAFAMGGVQQVRFNQLGSIIANGSIGAGGDGFIGWANNSLARSLMYSPADGQIELTNNAGSSFSRLQFGGTTSSFPALAVNGSDLQVIRADGSTNANLLVTGNVGIGTTSPGAQLHVVAGAAGIIGTIVKAAASQSVNIQEWQNSSATVLARVNSLGEFSNPNPQGGSGIQNERFGAGAGAALTTGVDNAAFGYRALYSNTTTSNNVAVGSQALYTNTAGSNTAVGYQALTSNSSGTPNTAVGQRALYLNTTGSENVAVGSGALSSNVTTSYNTAVGTGALQNTIGTGNSVLGDGAAVSNTTGSYNAAIGYLSLSSNQTGVGNLAMGYAAGYYQRGDYSISLGYGAGSGYGTGVFTATGSVSIGYKAGGTLNASTSGYNTLIGYQSGNLVTSGGSNIVLGSYQTAANSNITTGSNNIIIGNDIQAPSATTSNQLNIGNLIFGTGLSGTGSTIAGNIGIGTTAPGAKLEVAGSIKLSNNGYFIADPISASFRFNNSGDTLTLLTLANAGTATFGGSIVSGGNIKLGGSGYYIGNATHGHLFSNAAETANRMIIKDNGDVGIGGSITTGTLAGSSLFVQSTGNVGIGTTSPASNLEINGGSTTLTKNLLTVKGGGSAGAYGFSVQDNNANELFKVDTLSWNVTMGAAPGNVGIGTTSPGAKLHVVGAGGSSAGGRVAFFTDNNSQVGANLTIGWTGGGSNQKYKSIVVDSNGLNFGSMTDVLTALPTTQMIINNSGNVGIGSTSPTVKLDVNGVTNSTAVYVDGSQALDTSGLRLDVGSAGGFTSATIANGSSALLQLGGSTSSFPALKVVSSNLQVIRADGSTNADLYVTGNVGIGTTSPGSLLHLSSASATTLRLDTTGTSSYSAINFREGTNDAAYLEYINSAFATTNRRNNLELYNTTGTGGIGMFTNSTERLRIDSSGNVGIGTTAPGNKLSVNTPATAYSSADVMFTASASSKNALVLQGAASQSVRIFDVQDSSGTSYFRINSDGSFQASGTSIISGGGSLTTASGGGPAFFAVNHVGASGKNYQINSDSGGSFNVYDATAAVNRITVNTSGNVGIGTTSPAALLDISQTAAQTITATNNVSNITKSGAITNNTSALYNNGLSISNSSTSAGSNVVRNTGLNISVSGGDIASGVVINSSGQTTTNNGLTIGGTPLNSTAIYVNTGTVGRTFLVNNSTTGTAITDGTYFGLNNSDFRIVNQESAAVSFGTNNTADMLYLASTGNVGIGTTSPGLPLHILSPTVGQLRVGYDASNYTSFYATSAGNLSINPTGSVVSIGGTSNMSTTISGGGAGYSELSLTGGSTNNFISSDDRLDFYLGGTRMSITTAGNVGIGTTSPSHKLTVAAGLGDGMEIVSSSGNPPNLFFSNVDASPNANTRNWSISHEIADWGSLDFRVSTAAQGNPYTAGSTIMTLLRGGNVGIGTTVPGALLSVAGSVAAGGQVVINSTGDNAGLQLQNAGTTRWQIYQSGGGLNVIGANTARFIKTTAQAIENADNSNRVFSYSGTFNDASNKYYGLVTDITNTASAANSAIADFRVGGTSKVLFDISGNVGIGTTTPVAQLDVLATTSTVGINLAGTALGSTSSASGTDASNIITAVGTTGQATSFSNNLSKGGNGGAFSLTGGVGGDNSDSNVNISVNHRAGLGGAITLTSGTGGNATNASGKVTGGNGGAITLTTGTGGTSAGVRIAGTAGAFNVTGGTGGIATGASTSGAGGSLTLQGGIGGANSNASGSAGAGGSLTLDAGVAGSASGGASAGANGAISLGATNASSISIGNGSALTGSIFLQSALTTGTTTTSAFVVYGTSLTTGTLAYLNSTTITTGKLLDVTDTGNTWTGNGTTNGLIDLASSSTAGAASASSILLNLSRSGANSNTAHTAYGLYSNVTNTNGTSGTNIAAYLSASGATTANYGLIVAAGNVGIGTTAPSSLFHVRRSDTTRTDARFGNTQNAASQELAAFIFSGLDDGSAAQDYANITALISSPTAGAEKGRLDFNVHDAGSSGARLSIVGGNIGIGSTAPVSRLDIGSADLGDGVAGPVITLGRNTNATNTGAGSINFQSKAGTAGFIWQDNAGNVRIHTASPSNANDTSGTVVGTQTSTRDTKQDITPYTDYASALQAVVNAPLRTFRYIKEVQGYGTTSPLAKNHLGFIADEVSADFMQGNSIDQVSVNGLLMASVKALNEQITSLSVILANAGIQAGLSADCQVVLSCSLVSELDSRLRGNDNTTLAGVFTYNTNSNYVITTKQLYLSGDSVGQAKILAGATSVRVTFSKPYEQQPVVTATPNSRVGGEFWVADKDATGFTVFIDRSYMSNSSYPSNELNADVTFDWHAFASPEAKLTVSNGTTETLTLVVPAPPVVEEPTATPEPTPVVEELTPTPQPEGEVAGDLTPTPPAEEPVAP